MDAVMNKVLDKIKLAAEQKDSDKLRKLVESLRREVSNLERERATQHVYFNTAKSAR